MSDPDEGLVEGALFVFDESSAQLVERVVGNAAGVPVEAVPLATFLADPAAHAEDGAHLLVAAPPGQIKRVLDLAIEHDWSVGLVSSGPGRWLMRCLDLQGSDEAILEAALRRNDQPLDVVRCGGELVLVKAVIGWVPALDADSSAGFFGTLARTFRQLLRLRPRRYRITTGSGRVISTAASGCIVTRPHRGDVVGRLSRGAVSLRDGTASLVVTSPFSVIDYVRFLYQLLVPAASRPLPEGTGLVKSPLLTIESEPPGTAVIDGETRVELPVTLECRPACLRLNVGPRLPVQLEGAEGAGKETVRTAALPDEKESAKSVGRRLPIFSYASEERFRELFRSLRADARVDSIFVVLMVLSTLIAAVGLYQDSAAVIIGAMVLAPLMAPIVSLAMGILRAEFSLVRESGRKILLGVGIALAVSALLSLVFSYKPLTGEMQGRLSPSLLDLAVAILSGIAGAYAKSYKEILQSLAGVAIAVALVPPLAVAGIGLGRLDPVFFGQAFLLFLTNLVGIVIAATVTFRVLGFSPVVRAKRSFLVAAALLAAIAVPLYLSYDDIVQRSLFEQRVVSDRFLLNGKYVVVEDATLGRRGGRSMVTVTLKAWEPLDRADLAELGRKIQRYFEEDLLVEADIRYAL